MNARILIAAAALTLSFGTSLHAVETGDAPSLAVRYRTADLGEPERVRRLVLTVTSGGVDMTGLGAADWRSDYRWAFPGAASWITDRTASAPVPATRRSRPSSASATSSAGPPASTSSRSSMRPRTSSSRPCRRSASSTG